MKRFLGILFAMAALCAALLGCAASAEETDWTWEEQSDGTAVITGYSGETDTVTIPAEIGGKRVSGIADAAFAGSTGFTDVTVPGTVARIGNAAFAGIATLKTVTVEQGVEEIGSEAFTDCPNLTAVTLPESGVTGVGEKAFAYCYQLETVNLPSGIAEVPAKMFWECQNLTAIVIPEGVTGIADKAFWNCYALTSATLPESLVSIGAQAFHACTGLESVTLSANVTEIDETAFNDCDWLAMHAPEGSFAAQYAIEHQLVPEPAVLESTHPAVGNKKYTYEHPEEAAGLLVTFSYKTYLYGVFGTNSLLITDEEGNSQEYNKNSLSGVSLVLGGDSFTIQQRCSNADSDFGFRITEIKGLTQEEYDSYRAEEAMYPWLAHVVNGTLEITGYRGHETELTIPSHINNVSVRSIGAEAFYGNRNLTSLTVEAGVAVIGQDAFVNCTSLREVHLPDTIQEIESGAFYGNEALLSFDFPEGITVIRSSVLDYCPSLQRVTIPEGVTAIESSAFSDCGALKELRLPAGLTVLEPRAFAGSGLTSLTLPEGITEVPNYLCCECPDLRTVTLPEGVTSIGQHAFSECVSLAQIHLPAALKTIERCAFGSCPLTEITLPQGLETIGSNAFAGTQLTRVTIPASVTSMPAEAFFSCENLTEIILEGDGLDYTIRDGFFLNREGTTLLACVPGVQGILQVPDSVRHINADALGGLNRVTEIIVPETVESMDRAVFDKSAMTRVEIRAPITVLPDNSFNYCENLTDIVLPETLEDVGRLAFYRIAAKELIFPSNIKSIGMGAIASCSELETIVFPEGLESLSFMAIYSCPNLTDVYIPASVTSIGADTFAECPNAVVHTPAGSFAATWAAGQGIPVVSETTGTDGDISWTVDIYGTLTVRGEGEIKNYMMTLFVPWYACKDEITAVVVEEGITGIGNFAFADLAHMKSATLPDSVTRIGKSAFSMDTGLTSFAIPSGVTVIDEHAFNGSTGITAFSVAEANPAFKAENGIVFSKDGTALVLYPAGKPDTRYEIPDGTTVIGYNAFEKCTLLTEIVIPDSVREIQDNAFRACEGLTAMDIPEGVTTLGEWAFDTCMKLERLSLPSTLTNIPKNNISEDCYALREITVAEGNPNYCAEDGVLFTGDRTRLIVYPGGKTDPIYQIPEGVTVLDEYAFKLNGYLTRAIVPSGVAEIPTGVFRACQNLKCVVLSDSVTGIADGAFYECPALAEVFYAGTAEAWAQIRKGGLNQALENAGLVCLGDARVLSIPAHIREIQSEAFLNLTAADAIRIPEGEIAIAADFADAGTVLIVPSQEWAQWAETNGYRWVSWPEENP